jgi:hypothetical protein
MPMATFPTDLRTFPVALAFLAVNVRCRASFTVGLLRGDWAESVVGCGDEVLFGDSETCSVVLDAGAAGDWVSDMRRCMRLKVRK